MLNWKTLGVVVVVSAGLVVAGCKSAPELSKEQALKMVQDKYDQTAPVGVNILVNDSGMLQGATAKLRDRTKVFPNKLWADFKLTPEGKKAVVLPGGGDTIEWRPANLEDKNYSIVVTTVAANHLRGKDMGDLQHEMLPGADTAKAGSICRTRCCQGRTRPKPANTPRLRTYRACRRRCSTSLQTTHSTR